MPLAPFLTTGCHNRNQQNCRGGWTSTVVSLRTLTGYEGMGLATACTHATIMEGVRRGVDPLWITEVTNHGSRAIAEQIGLRLHAE